jgi:propanediol dehydratase small subunit
MLISNDQLSSQLNILTDYIVSPDLRKINRTQSNVDVTVYSILDNTTRHENLTITNGQLGGKFKLSKIKDCILRITKVFFGSPC